MMKQGIFKLIATLKSKIINYRLSEVAVCLFIANAAIVIYAINLQSQN